MSRGIPVLPRDDSDPGSRERQVAKARETYEYDYSYQSLCFMKKLPPSEKVSAAYLAQAFGATVRLKQNRTEYAVSRRRIGSDLDRVASLAEYDAMYKAIPAPPTSSLWNEDWTFAWQRIAGAVSTEITGIDRLPDNFPVTQAHFARAVGEGERLDAALAEGRIFLCDYRVFDGVPCGRYPPLAKDGLRKYLEAPLVLFYATPKIPGGLAPVAIQCGQRPGEHNPIYTPADGERWRLAKYVVQVADANLEGIVVHFGYTHMILQRFIMAARRRMSADHPLLHLLAPHFEFTLAANQFARETLVVVDGTQDRILCPTLPATQSLLRACEREVQMEDLDPVIDARKHRVLSVEALPVHPFRDDGLDAWHATRRWVERYVSLYYPTDADAAADLELRAMLDEVGAIDGGQLPRLVAGVSTDTRKNIVDIVARIIHRASTYHASINYNWWDWMGYIPNAPSVCVGPMPGPGDPVDEATLFGMLPPKGVIWETFHQIYTVHQIRRGRLGEYPDGFADPRVEPHLAAFRADLTAVEERIAERNRTRPLAYECLRPSLVTASINS